MSVTQASLVDRMMRAIRADVNLFEEVERDQSATTQAATVVAIVAVASAIGAGLGATMAPAVQGVPAQGFVGAFFAALIGAFIGWVVWSYVTYFVGTRLFNGTATPGEMLRCIGFAQSPQVLAILTFIPILGPILGFLLFLWSIYIGFVAVRQALDIDNTKAILTIVISAIVTFIVSALVTLVIRGLLTPFAA
jgi:hypothetical protein